MPADQIHLRNLQLPCHIGVPDEERSAPQLLHADVCIHCRMPFEAMKDDITLTIDYALVSARLRHIASEKPRRLIETLAADLAACVIQEFLATAVEITIKKRILPETEHVAVRLFRQASTNA
jgi:dihydroneopterin aldolase